MGQDKRIELRSKGWSGDIAEVETLLTSRKNLIAEINRIEADQAQLLDLREQRLAMLTELATVRDVLPRRGPRAVARARVVGRTGRPGSRATVGPGRPGSRQPCAGGNAMDYRRS